MQSSAGGRSASKNVGTALRTDELPAAWLPSKPRDLGSQATDSNSQQMQVSLLCFRHHAQCMRGTHPAMWS